MGCTEEEEVDDDNEKGEEEEEEEAEEGKGGERSSYLILFEGGRSGPSPSLRESLFLLSSPSLHPSPPPPPLSLDENPSLLSLSVSLRSIDPLRFTRSPAFHERESECVSEKRRNEKKKKNENENERKK